MLAPTVWRYIFARLDGDLTVFFNGLHPRFLQQRQCSRCRTGHSQRLGKGERTKDINPQLGESFLSLWHLTQNAHDEPHRLL